MPSTMNIIAAIALAFATLTSANLVAAQEQPTELVVKPVRYGFAIDGGVSVLTRPSYLVENLFIGAKLDRVLVTTGLEVHNERRREIHFNSWGNLNLLCWGIQVQVAILRSNDQRVEFNGIGGYAVGNEENVIEDLELGPRTLTTLHQLGRLGFGVRYWAMPQLAIGLNMGLAYRSASGDYFGSFTQFRVIFVAGS